MCGIYCSTNGELKKDSFGERLLKLRGPDCLTKINIEQFNFSHSLLSITGNFKFQPHTKDNIVCLYNGEIYNQHHFGSNYESDGESIIDAYKFKGVEFTKYLDGEFALILYDMVNGVLIVSTDVFGTKPLYYSSEGKNFGCASYRSPLEEAGHNNIKKFNPNTTLVFSDKDFSIVHRYSPFTFNIEQFKTSFDDWDKAFTNSIYKRVNNCNKKIFIGLSSGYDSGVICHQLLKQEKEFKAFSVLGTEDEQVINDRQYIISGSNHGNYESFYKTDHNWGKSHDYIQKNTENYKYNISAEDNPFDNWRGCDLIDDSGSNWLSLICDRASKEGFKVHMSGMGADEIFSDYGFNGKPVLPHSNFGGLFPDDLNSIFPWGNFYGGSMDAYITKEEYVGGAYGIETRYPFLDKYVVQEFINLDKNLKNSNYKSVLYEYLKCNDFPFKENQKLGF